VLILGLGVSGSAAAEYLLRKGTHVIAVDKNASLLQKAPPIASLLERGLELFSEDHLISFVSIFFVVLSPGISRNHPLVQRALSENIEVVGEVEFALRYLRNRCCGITGTNGKTTTTLLTAHILQSSGLPARALGNVGTSLSSYLLQANDEDILVLELSSFQLETLQTRCLTGAVILNITPDHLDRYDSIDCYIDAKMRIASCLLDEKNFFVSRQAYQYTKKGIIFDESLSSSQNEQAAYHLTSLFGVSPSQFFQALSTFKKPPHRIEWVAEKNGSVYYNDSKATNVEAVLHAVNSFTGPLILLIGGLDKGAPYTPWIDPFRSKVKMLIAFGQAAFTMESQLAPALPFCRVATLSEAVQLASTYAKGGASVLLSPGCSSYDQFRNYEQRGDEFKCLVREL
jgi:UDP-N-acetylmuramoylalanine--D-glutamate ligase